MCQLKCIIDLVKERFIDQLSTLFWSFCGPTNGDNLTLLGMEVYDYLDSLPLKHVVQVHVSGPRIRDGRLVDAHEPMQEIDYALLDYDLSRTQPQVVTLEYIRDRDALHEQLGRLRKVVDSA